MGTAVTVAGAGAARSVVVGSGSLVGVLSCVDSEVAFAFFAWTGAVASSAAPSAKDASVGTISWVGVSTITSRSIGGTVSWHPNKSPPTKIKLKMARYLCKARWTPLAGRLHLCHPAHFIDFECPITAQGEISVLFYIVSAVYKLLAISAEGDPVVFITLALFLTIF